VFLEKLSSPHMSKAELLHERPLGDYILLRTSGLYPERVAATRCCWWCCCPIEDQCCGPIASGEYGGGFLVTMRSAALRSDFPLGEVLLCMPTNFRGPMVNFVRMGFAGFRLVIDIHSRTENQVMVVE
jgi:hypothetical protein